MRKFLIVLTVIVSSLVLTGCSDADVASNNLSKAADQFEVNRRIVFYNGISGEYILTIEGYCSLGNYDAADELTVTCKTGEGEYKKHFLGLSDNVTYFAEQVESEGVSADQWSAIVTLLRTKFGRQKHNYRLYQSKTGEGGWKRV